MADDSMRALQAERRRYVDAIAAATGLKYAQIAKAASLSPSTLTRFMNGEPGWNLSDTTLQKLITRFGKDGRKEAGGAPSREAAKDKIRSKLVDDPLDLELLELCEPLTREQKGTVIDAVRGIVRVIQPKSSTSPAA